MTTRTEENYLKALYHLSEKNQAAGVNELSKILGIKMPSVNSMMKKFEMKNWVTYEPYKPLVLTSQGKKEAALIVRKHRLTEMFLVEKMGFGWEQVHEIAEEIEHIQSSLFFDKIDELLEYPKTDPHGSAIPDKSGSIERFNYKSLSQGKKGDVLVFCALTESTSEFLKYLNAKNLSLGMKLTIESVEEFDKSMKVSYGGKTHEFSEKVTQRLLMEKA